MSQITPETESQLEAAYKQLDQIEQLIVISAARDLAAGKITSKQFALRVQDQAERHRAGKPVYISELGF
ncbi:hypothetical protein [Paracoccus litorisediminis]|uniref:Uncharacterized protein n=1 Tax=Paracoccus litorisediminis TaxID=2006130 RepID=A0A844HGN8_9RHOB|nr:hypothetical protein [Paracoccus litorisediminis]MTH58990.1 hypothetical protein [Paracoccus litorisediminis]